MLYYTSKWAQHFTVAAWQLVVPPGFFEEIYFQPIYTDYEYFYDEKMTLKYLQKSELWLLYF